MNRTANIFIMVLVFLFAAASANAFMEQVFVPKIVESGAPFSVMVFGYLADPCWEVVNQRHLFDGNVITFDVFTAYTAPPGSGCPQVIVPYDVAEQMTIPDAGSWLVRVVEHRYNPYWPETILQTLEFEVTATGTVTMEKISWGTLRAHYR
jgi:hypothetical protein